MSILKNVPPDYRPDIDGLRALAVLSVVFFHASPHWLQGGYVGVDIFFVISGFLITKHILHSLDGGQFSFANFVMRRILRLFPCLIVVFVASLIFGWMALFPDEYSQLAKHIFSAAAFVLNFILVQESGYFDNSSITKPMLHLWSLSVEEQFYIIWPLILLIGYKVGVKLSVILGVIFFSSLLVCLSLVNKFPVEIFYFPIGRLWEFLTGGFLSFLIIYRGKSGYMPKRNPNHFASALIRLSTDHRWLKNTASFFGVGLILLSFSILNEELSHPSEYTIMPVLGAALVIWAGPSSFLNRFLFCNPISIWVGLISYPLYLWHWPILSFLQIIEGGTPPRELRILAVLLSILLAWITYKCIEQPIRYSARPLKTVVFLIGGLVAIAVFGLLVHSKNGFPERGNSPFNYVEGGEHSLCLNLDKNIPCVLGNLTSSKEILVYGDSHALHLTKSINQYFGDEYRINVLWDNSCFMDKNLTSWHRELKRKLECQDKIQLLMTDVFEKNYDIVITSQRWHGYRFKGVDDFELVISNRIKNFDIKSSNLVIVGSTVDVDYNCEKKNFRPLSLGKNCKPGDKSTLKEVENFEIASGKFSQDAIFIHPYKLICKDQPCGSIVNGVVNYTDSNHLSKHASDIVVGELLKKLNM